MKNQFLLLKKISITVTAILLALMLTATAIAVENKSSVSSFFGSKTFEVIESEEDKDADKEYYKSKYSTLKDVNDAGLQVAEDISAEGMVLLKNTNNALPLAKTSKVTMFGVASASPTYGGRGSAHGGNPQNTISLKTGMESAGFVINNDVFDFYDTNVKKYDHARAKIMDSPWVDLEALSGSYATYGDAAIYVYKRTGGEGFDGTETDSTGAATDGDFLKLGVNEMSILKGLKAEKDKGTFKKIIVLVNTAAHIEYSYLFDPALGIDAALWIGNIGQTGAYAVGKMLAGDVTPSGRSTDMLWLDNSANPVMTNFGDFTYGGTENFDIPVKTGYGGTTAPDTQFMKYVVYQEGVYLGYRYAETRYEDQVLKTANAGSFDYGKVVALPFGGGLSYTEFSYSDYTLEKKDDIYTVKLNVTNTGSKAGKEVVQVYVQKPYTKYNIENGVEQPSIELVGFAKTGVIEPGKSVPVTIKVDERDFTTYDANKAKTYIIQDGTYYLAVGKNSHDALNNVLAVKGKTTADGMDYNGNKNMVKSIKKSFSDTKYAISEGNILNGITNLFDESDINKYSGRGSNTAKYISRSDWAGTVELDRSKGIKLEMTKKIFDDMMAGLDISTIKEDNIELPAFGKANGLNLMSLRLDTDGNKIPYDDPAWDMLLDQLTWEEVVAICSTGYRKTAAVVSISKPETKDHNGPTGLTQPYAENPYGLAARTGTPITDKTRPVAYPCIGLLASTFNVDVATAFGNSLGEEAIWAGYAGYYGIGLNMHRSPYEGRGFEYYSEDPFLAGRISAQQVSALQKHGCYAYIKHFALNEQETNRHGNNVWLSEQALRQIYLEPYKMAIIEGGASAVMTNFGRVGTVNCPNNKALMTDFLRGECGFIGLAVTDMYSQYSSVKMPLLTLAGCDIPDGDLVGGKGWDKDPFLSFTGSDGKIKGNYGELAQAMRESAHRILYTTVHSNAMNSFGLSTQIKMIMPNWLVAVTVIDVVLGILFLGAIGFAVADFVIKKKKPQTSESA